MQKLTIARVFRKEEFSEKKQKNYIRISVKTQEYGDRWISGFGNEQNKGWEAGDTVEVFEVSASANRDRDGNPYLNFKMPKLNMQNNEEIHQIYLMIKEMHDSFKARQGTKAPAPAPTTP